jgi:hypothetical protein
VVVVTADNKVYQFPNAECAADFEDKAREVGGSTLRLLPPSAPRPEATRSLYDVEDHLAAMTDTAELVTLDQEQSFIADLQAALTAAAEKRDRVGQFFAHCESQAILATQEMERLKKRMEGYVAMVIVSLGADSKGKFRKLEGNTTTFRVQRNPPTVVVENEAAIPARFKSVSVTLPAEIWDSVLESVPLDLRELVLDAVRRATVSVSKTAIKDAIEETVPACKAMLADQSAVTTEAVPGAAILAGSLRLVRE